MKLQKQIEALEFLNRPDAGRKIKNWLQDYLDDDAQICVMNWILDCKEYTDELAKWNNGKRIDK